MTPKQHACLTFIAQYWSERGYGPTYRNIAAAIGTSLGHTHAIVETLIARGEIVRRRGESRSLRVADNRDVVPVVAAATALLDSLKKEIPEGGVAVVGLDALGALDVAVAEYEAEARPGGAR